MDDDGVFATEDDKVWIATEDGIEELKITISPLPPELAAKREAEDPGMVDHWHATLARPDADGTWDYELMESPVLAEDWPTYQPFELPAVSLNYGLYPARESAEGNSGLARTTPAASWPGRTVAYPQAHLEAWTVAGAGTQSGNHRAELEAAGGKVARAM